MIIGGFLTTERWLAEAITKKARPTGLFYPGLLKLKTRLKIHVCEDTKSQHPELWKLFLKLQRFQKVLLLEFKVLLREWNKYLGQRGVRSQPWLPCCISRQLFGFSVALASRNWKLYPADIHVLHY